jgi:streptomycin 6-kinase
VPRTPRTLEIPASLRPLERVEGGAEWLASLPDLVAALEARWAVRASHPFEGGTASWSAPVDCADGRDAVLKINWPHREAHGEATALRFWDGDGAVAVYECDAASRALLIERCRPGTKLLDAKLAPDDILRVGADVLARLWRAPDDASAYERVDDVAAEWARQVRERFDRLRPPFDAGLVELGAQLLESLPAHASRDVVVHGDANPGNMLAATREPWLAIDPKPMVGDPAYDPSQFVLQVDPTQDPALLRARFEEFGARIGEDPQRLMAWAVARDVESAMWHLAHARRVAAEGAIEEASLLTGVASL